mgnify:CR=1 FL=1
MNFLHQALAYIFTAANWTGPAGLGMRMLEPHELFAAQGFPADYVIDHDATGKKFTKTAQVARCGNAVCPPLAAALVRANLPEMCADAQEEAA